MDVPNMILPSKQDLMNCLNKMLEFRQNERIKRETVEKMLKAE